MEPWQFYLDDFKRRAAHVPAHAFGRGEILAEAAHDAYQATANHLTGDGWDAEEALIVTHMFGQAVKEWLARNGSDWDSLQTDLGRRYANWSQSERK